MFTVMPENLLNLHFDQRHQWTFKNEGFHVNNIKGVKLPSRFDCIPHHVRAEKLFRDQLELPFGCNLMLPMCKKLAAAFKFSIILLY
jgi:hypothetical protein